MSKLYIIGNGFDLKHGIPSRYSDFAKFVKGTDFELYQRIERYYPNIKEDLWNNFEEALGLPDYNELINDYELLIKKKMAQRDEYLGVIPFSLKEILGKWLFALSEYILNTHLKKMYQLDLDSFYISFNYTRTLESHFNIKDERICYIHNCIPNDKESKWLYTDYIFGHGRTSFVLDIDTILNSGRKIESNMIDKLSNVFKDFNKEIQGDKCTSFINEKNSFNITDIITLGHSLATIDHPYFRILNSLCHDAKWHIGYFDKDDMVKKIFYCAEIGIDNPVFFLDK